MAEQQRGGDEQGHRGETDRTGDVHARVVVTRVSCAHTHTHLQSGKCYVCGGQHFARECRVCVMCVCV